LNGSKPFGTKWQWEFRAKDKPDAQDTAPWLLMCIKLAHYFTLVAQGTLSYVLFAAGSYLTSGAWHVGGVQVRDMLAHHTCLFAVSSPAHTAIPPCPASQLAAWWHDS
jgi:hypothetical protein